MGLQNRHGSYVFDLICVDEVFSQGGASGVPDSWEEDCWGLGRARGGQLIASQNEK